MTDPHNIKQPDYNLVAMVMPGTINVIRLGLVKPGQKEAILVGDFGYLPNLDPNLYFGFMTGCAEAAARAVAGVLKDGHHVVVDGASIKNTTDAVVKAVMRKAQSSIIAPDGKSRTLNVDKNGAIPGDIREVLGLDSLPGETKVEPPIVDVADTLPKPKEIKLEV